MCQHSLPKLDQRLDTSKLLAHEKGLQLKQIGDGTSSIMRTYRNLKVGYDKEQYLSTIKSQRLRALLSRLRCMWLLLIGHVVAAQLVKLRVRTVFCCHVLATMLSATSIVVCFGT